MRRRSLWMEHFLTHSILKLFNFQILRNFELRLTAPCPSHYKYSLLNRISLPDSDNVSSLKIRFIVLCINL
jgi:hypothetical protein